MKKKYRKVVHSAVTGKFVEGKKSKSPTSFIQEYRLVRAPRNKRTGQFKKK